MFTNLLQLSISPPQDIQEHLAIFQMENYKGWSLRNRGNPPTQMATLQSKPLKKATHDMCYDIMCAFAHWML